MAYLELDSLSELVAAQNKTPLSDIEAPHLGTEAPPLSLDEDGVTCSSPSLAQLPESGCHCEANESAAATSENFNKVYTSQPLLISGSSLNEGVENAAKAVGVEQLYTSQSQKPDQEGNVSNTVILMIGGTSFPDDDEGGQLYQS